MPVKKTLTCKEDVIEELKKLLHRCYKLRAAHEIISYTYCVTSKNKVNIYYYKSQEELARLYPKLNNIVDKLVSLGIQYALYKVETAKLYPSLGLLTIIRLLNSPPTSHYVIVESKAAMLFTYGRDILHDSIIKLNHNQECKRYPLIVMNEEVEPIGFGTLKRMNGRVLIQNILDVGWYLRSGV